MRQTPHEAYLIVGMGRLGRHLAAYFDQLKTPFRSWTRLDGIDQFYEKARTAEILLLCLSDDVIAEFYHHHSYRLRNKQWVHFSGSQSVDGIDGFHPLYTFTPELYDLETYQKIPFAADLSNRLSFHETFPTLKNPYFGIPSEKKALYHALCVMAGNFYSILWNKYFKEMKNMGIQEEHCRPYCERIFQNIWDDHEKSLTGPIVRKDEKTMKRNLESLENDSFAPIYQAFKELKR